MYLGTFDDNGHHLILIYNGTKTYKVMHHNEGIGIAKNHHRQILVI